MGSTSEFLAGIPRRKDGKRIWPLDLMARMGNLPNLDGVDFVAIQREDPRARTHSQKITVATI